MGNAADNEANNKNGFYESEGDDDQHPNNHEHKSDPNVYINNGHHQHHHHQHHHHHPPPAHAYQTGPLHGGAEADHDDDVSIYQSQYAMNLYGVTDSGEFVTNAVKRIPAEHHVSRIKQLFKYKKKLGEGASGKVLLVEEKFGARKGLKCALKELPRKHRVNAQLFLREVVILESLQHGNILELYGVYLDQSSYYIATAYYSGGEFFDRIVKSKKFSEKQALAYIKPMLSAVRFMHDQAIVHRDLKPSNMVFDRKGKHGMLKIIDFGTSEIVIDDDVYSAERVGTILYAPPEWKRDRVGADVKKGDLWSLGVIVYVLMVGRLPFGEWRHIEAYANDLWFPQKLRKKLSFQCVDFILKLLRREAGARLSAAQALAHAWIGEEAAEQVVDDLGAELKSGLQSVRQEDKISRAIGRVHAGKLDVEDLDAEDRRLVYEHVTKEQDVERYMLMYRNNNNVDGQPPPAQPPPPSGPPPPQLQAALALAQPPSALAAYSHNKQNNNHQQAPVFGKDVKHIFASINEFREQQQAYPQASPSQPSQQSAHAIAAENAELPQDEYEQKVNATLSRVRYDLDHEQEQKELMAMLGEADYYALQQKKAKAHSNPNANAKRKASSVADKNSGNPLNISCADDEEFEFDTQMVDTLLHLGYTKNACIRAVLATDSKGVEQAAEWLMDHANDAGINDTVDVL